MANQFSLYRIAAPTADRSTAQQHVITVEGDQVMEEAEVRLLTQLKFETGEQVAAREGDDLVVIFADGSTLRLKKYYLLLESGQLRVDVEGLEVPGTTDSGSTDSSGGDDLGELDGLGGDDEDDDDDTQDNNNTFATPLANAVADNVVAAAQQQAAVAQAAVAPNGFEAVAGTGDFTLVQQPNLIDDLIHLQLEPAGIASRSFSDNNNTLFTIDGVDRPSEVFTQTGPTIIKLDKIRDVLFNQVDDALLPGGGAVTYFGRAVDGQHPAAVNTNDVTSTGGQFLQVSRVIQKEVDSAPGTEHIRAIEIKPNDAGSVGLAPDVNDPELAFTFNGRFGTLLVGRQSGNITYVPYDTADATKVFQQLGKNEVVQDVFQIRIEDTTITGANRFSDVELVVRVVGINDSPTILQNVIPSIVAQEAGAAIVGTDIAPQPVTLFDRTLLADPEFLPEEVRLNLRPAPNSLADQLGQNPITTVAGSSTALVYMPSHHLSAGDQVDIKGVTGAGLSPGLSAGQIAAEILRLTGAPLTVLSVINSDTVVVQLPSAVGAGAGSAKWGGGAMTMQDLSAQPSTVLPTGVNASNYEILVFSNNLSNKFDTQGNIIVTPTTQNAQARIFGSFGQLGSEWDSSAETGVTTVVKAVSLGANPIKTTAGSDEIVVTITDRNLQVGDTIRLSGLAAVDNFTALQLNTVHIVKAVDLSGKVTIDLNTAPAANTVAAGGGAGGQFEETAIVVQGKFGTLELHADGTYTYTRTHPALVGATPLESAALEAAAVDNFTVVLRDTVNDRQETLLLPAAAPGPDQPTNIFSLTIKLDGVGPFVGQFINGSLGGGDTGAGAVPKFTLPQPTAVAPDTAHMGFNITELDSLVRPSVGANLGIAQSVFQPLVGLSGSNTLTLTLAQAASLAVGYTVTGTDVPTSTVITAIDTLTGVVSLNKSFINDVAGDDLTFIASNIRDGSVLNVSDLLSLKGVFGTLTVNWKTGEYSYTLDQLDPDTQALGVNGALPDNVTDQFLYTVFDGPGTFVNGVWTENDYARSDKGVLNVTVLGANDTPISSTIATPTGLTEIANAALQDIAPIAGTMAVSDLDKDDVLTGSINGTPVITWSGGTPDGASTTALTAALVTGKLTFDSTVASPGASIANPTGATTLNWTYDPAAVNLDFLALGETLQISFNLQATDPSGAVTAVQNVTFTITGTNDAPTVSVSTDGALTEDNTAPTLDSTGTITFDDVDLNDTHTVLSVTPNVGNVLGGTFLASVNGGDPATGAGSGTVDWSYSVLNSATQFLSGNQQITEKFTVRIQDNQLAFVDREITITITGTNDTPVINAIADTPLNEQTNTSALTSTIGVTFTDVDLTDVGHVATITNVTTAGTTAGLTLDTDALKLLVTPGAVTKLTGSSAGSVNLGFSAASTAFNYLAVGESVELTYTVQINDGDGATPTQTFKVTIAGTNDAPDIRIEPGDLATGALTENNTQITTNDTLNVVDVDFSNTVNVSITGVAVNASSTFDFDPDDVDAPLNTAELLGMMVLTNNSAVGADPAAGSTFNWTFTSGTSDEGTFSFLGVGKTVVLDYTLQATDGNGGTDTQIVKVTITGGTNDAPDIRLLAGDTAVGSVIETNTTLTDTGGLNVVDRQKSDKVTVTVDSVAVDPSSIGINNPLNNAILKAMMTLKENPGDTPSQSIELDANPIKLLPALGGSNFDWTFTSGSSANNAFNFLAAGEIMVLNYTLKATDDSTVPATDTQVVAITITGANDAPLAGNDTGVATEAAGVGNGTAGSNATGNVITIGLGADIDVDNNAVLAISQIRTGAVEGAGTAGTVGVALTGLHGSLTLNADGSYTYTVNENDAAVQALNAAGTVQDSFNYTVSDGTVTDTAVLVITINGANDSAVISGTISGNVTEAGGVGNAIAGTPTATGNLTSADVDNANTFIAITAGTVSTGGLGTFSMTAAGVWTYTLNNNNTTVQALAAAAPASDSFTVTSVDGTQQLISINITGANDAPVADLDSTAGGLNDTVNFTEGGAAVPVAGANFSITDVDGTSITGATITLTNEKNGDVLTVGTLPGGIAANVVNNIGSIVVTLSGTASLDDYETAIRAITFDNGGGNPSNTPRIITVVVTDGITSSSAATMTITVDEDNDAPTATASDGVAAEQVPLDLAGKFTIDDIDANSGTMTLTLTGGNAGQDRISVNVGVTGALLTSGGNGTTNAAIVTGTLVQLQALLATANAVTYTAASDTPVNSTVLLNINDNGNTGTGGAKNDSETSNITVTEVNDTPTATDDGLSSVAEESGLRVISFASLLGNDFTGAAANEGAQTLTITAVNTVVGGTAVINGTNIEFTPGANFEGTASFNYVIQDNGTTNGANDFKTDTGSVSFAVTPVNDPPTAVNDNGSAGENETKNFAVLVNDVDIDVGDTQTLVSIDSVGLAASANSEVNNTNVSGAFTLDGSEIKFTPGTLFDALAPGQSATVAVVYTMKDSQNVTSTATLTLTVNGVNDAALIAGDSNGNVTEAGGTNNGTAGTPSDTGLLTASDVDNTDDTFIAAGPAAGLFGTFAINAGGTWTYNLNNNNAAVQGLAVGQIAIDTFTVFSVDGTSKIVTVDVLGANDAPVGESDSGTAGENETKLFDVVVNDTDVDNGAVLSLASIDSVGAVVSATALNGIDASSAFSIDAGQIKFTPGALFDSLNNAETATVTVNYNVQDAQGATSTSSLTLTVNGTNEIPVALDLDGNGLQFQSLADSTHLVDMNGDGTTERIAWVSGNDGILAHDGNHDGLITERSEFVFSDHAAGAKTDLEALHLAFDTNNDYKLDALDQEWSSFGVWHDVNQDGTFAANEFQSLEFMGITSLSLVSDHVASSPAEGVLVTGQTSFTWADGHTGLAADVAFAYSSGEAAVAATGTAQGAGDLTSMSSESFASAQLHAADAGSSSSGIAANSSSLPHIDEVLQNTATAELQLPPPSAAPHTDAAPAPALPPPAGAAVAAAPGDTGSDPQVASNNTGDSASAPANDAAPPPPPPVDDHAGAPAAVV